MFMRPDNAVGSENIRTCQHAAVWVFTADCQMLKHDSPDFHVFTSATPFPLAQKDGFNDRTEYQGKFVAHRLGLYMTQKGWNELPASVWMSIQDRG